MVRQRKPKITTPEEPLSSFTEQAKAMWWRQHKMQMTREQLSAVTAYGVDTILSLETKARNTVTANKAWRRYRNACEAAHRAYYKDDLAPFNWGMPTEEPDYASS